MRDPATYWSPNGQSHWTAEPHRGHSYLVTKVPQREMEKIIGDLMAAPPQAKGG